MYSRPSPQKIGGAAVHRLDSHSTILLVHSKTFTRLILILTGSHDYEVMGSLYCLKEKAIKQPPKIVQKCSEILILFHNLQPFASDQIKEEDKKKVFVFSSTF